jgi:hypothetical protein
VRHDPAEQVQQCLRNGLQPYFVARETALTRPLYREMLSP